MTIPTVEQLLEAGAHFGHRASKWHPKMAPYIFGERKGVHIIDLAKTQTALSEALAFIEQTAASNKRLLFVGTKTQVKGQLKKMAQEVKMPYVTERWLGGTITNFPVIKRSIKKYKDLLDKKEAGKLNKYTKKERLQFDRQIAKLELTVGGLVELNYIPEVVFVWDIKTEKTALAEARKKGIKVIAICDTNTNPEGIDYVIPANDDASKTIKLILDLIKEAISNGRATAARQKE